MKKIVIISDTHGDKVNYKRILEQEKADIAIHAGDYCINYDIVKESFDYVVCGNNDFEGQEILDFEIEGFKIRLMHGHQFPTFLSNRQKLYRYLLDYVKDNQIDILITGHTHIEHYMNANNNIILNPGSLSFPRNSTITRTYAVLELDNKTVINDDFFKIIKYLA